MTADDTLTNLPIVLQGGPVFASPPDKDDRKRTAQMAACALITGPGPAGCRTSRNSPARGDTDADAHPRFPTRPSCHNFYRRGW